MAAMEKLAKAVAVAQHHDAITGTEKQHVANDYHKKLDQGMVEFMQVIDTQYCPQLNISQCQITEEDFDELRLFIYNPLAHVRTSIVHLPVVANSKYTIYDENDNVQEHQLTPLSEEVMSVPGRTSLAQFDLAFLSSNVPPFGIKAFIIKREVESEEKDRLASKVSEALKGNWVVKTTKNKAEMKISIESNQFSFFNSLTNQSVTHQLGYYKAFQGNNSEPSNQASGAYIFRPLEQETTILDITKSKMFTGPIYSELQLTYGDSASLLFRIPVDQSLYDAEIEWMVGPINVDDEVGKEYISKWKVDGTFEQDGLFYTDANGRQSMERKRDFRPSYNLGYSSLEEPVSSNYYPINSAIFIRDRNQELQLTVLNDRAQGGSSLQDGEIELMIHRRLLHDDKFGVGEALNEEAYGTGLVATGRHFVSLDSNFKEGNAKRRFLSNEIAAPQLVIFTNQTSLFNIKEIFQTKVNPGLPLNVNLLSFEPWFNSSNINANNQYLVRLEHLFEEGEHSKHSEPVTLSLIDLFGPASLSLGKLSFAKETTLGGNQWKPDDVTTLHWKIKNEDSITWAVREEEPSTIDLITIQPMDIRTFIVEFEKM